MASPGEGAGKREALTADLLAIVPHDAKEARQISETLAWILSGAELYRLEKPAIPPKHLVAYFLVTDGDHILLVDHKDAGLWLPSGGHVDPGENPRDTVIREAMEELGIAAVFAADEPVMLTAETTVGVSAGHVDVCLWYVLTHDRHAPLRACEDEFNSVRWFHYNDCPRENAEPNLERFVEKYFG